MTHITINRAQREAVFCLYQRALNSDHLDHRPDSYREFRAKVQLGWDCIMVPAMGIWFGIETDGYTHS